MHIPITGDAMALVSNTQQVQFHHLICVKMSSQTQSYVCEN